jgi:predicted nucleic acid-binding protein
MIVIADTSPLNYLIGKADVLHNLYGRVAIPQAVLDELQHPKAPAVVSVWIQRRPTWLEVHQVAPIVDASLRGLDWGECQAILLAEQHGPEVLLLIDEEKGRREAERRQIRNTGILGVLNDAAVHRLIELPTATRPA